MCRARLLPVRELPQGRNRSFGFGVVYITCAGTSRAVWCRYYGYRVTQNFDEDPRLQHLDPAWFTGKSLLDIGCNDGLLTMSLACKFGCQSVMGVDIDSQLIAKACRSLSGLRTKYTKDIASASSGSKYVSVSTYTQHRR